MNYAVCFLPLIRIFVDLVKEMWQAILGKIMNPINILIWLPWCFNVINNNWLLRTLFGCSVLRMTPPCLRFVFVQPLCSSCRLRHDFHYHVPHPDQWSVVQLISSSHRAPIWKKITDLVILSWQSSRQSFNISWAHNVFSSDSWKKKSSFDSIQQLTYFWSNFLRSDIHSEVATSRDQAEKYQPYS